MEEDPQILTDNTPPSQTKESHDIPLIHSNDGNEKEQTSVQDKLPDGRNQLFMSMMNQINDGLKEGIREMGEKL